MAEHDHILLNTACMGRVRLFVEDMQLIKWPPPERIHMDGETKLLRKAVDDDDSRFTFKRISMSQLTDKQIAKCPGVCRGAEYVYEEGLN